ncbi:MAG: SpoIIIAH-like family protein [Clostridia bacterium]|nr:SpoIIIAH-like family protein [Clostridia bacterium]
MKSKVSKLKLTKKGIIALALLAALLVGAVYLNIQLNSRPEDGGEQNRDALNKESGEAKPVNADVYSGYFSSFRNERNVVRAQEIEYLRMIIDEETSDAETIKGAQDRLMELVSNMEKEFAIESQIRSKGFLDAAVTFRNDAITVVIDGASLSDEEVARILDIVKSETGASASAVRISLSRASA